MIGVARGFATVVGAAIAGALLWFATQLGTEASGEYWATYGLIAAAGLAMALSQILGGWTKWGWPRFSTPVFALGFLPVLVVGLWLLLARQPADFFNTSNWSRDLGIGGLVADLGNILPAIAFAVGLAFGFSFDTAGRTVTVADRDAVVTTEPIVPHDADAPLTAEHGEHRAPEASTPTPAEPPLDDAGRPLTPTSTTTEERRED